MQDWPDWPCARTRKNNWKISQSDRSRESRTDEFVWDKSEETSLGYTRSSSFSLIESEGNEENNRFRKVLYGMHVQHLYFPDFSGFFIALQVRQGVRNLVAVMYSNLFASASRFFAAIVRSPSKNAYVSQFAWILEDVESFHDNCLGFMDFVRLWMRRSFVLPSRCQK